MKGRLTHQPNVRLLIASLLSLVVCLQVSTMNSLAQTKSARFNSDGQLVERLAQKPGGFRVNFTYAPQIPIQGKTVQFKDLSTGNPTSWEWNFGDGSTSTDQNPIHIFSNWGYQRVTLLASNSMASKKIIRTVKIVAAKTTNTTNTTSTSSLSEPIMAASASLADVSAAVARANSGDTVIVPAGTATWNNQLVITKGISLIGAGIGQTVIISNYSASNPDSIFTSTNYLIIYCPTLPSENTPFRLSGFSLELNNKCWGLMLKNKSTTAINQIRIDHNHIENSNVIIDKPWHGINIHIYGTVYGVADNNEFISGLIRCNGLDATTWNNLMFDFGTADNFYIEDNNFTSPDTAFFYGEMGSRYCARHNTFDAAASTNGLYPFADMHGNQPNAHNAAMGAEIYENIINGGTKGVCLLDQRGGKALVYNNTITTTSTTVFAKAREEFFDSINPPESSPISGQPQHVSDSYYWGNRNGTTMIHAGVATGGTLDYGGDLGLVPQQNRDVWIEKTDFDGTIGVGIGPLADRPATCTVGVAYWATDTKTLYRCTASNTWTEYYRPYPYPHPLRTILSN